MKTYQIIIDTNVLVASSRSKQGASYRLLDLLKNKDERCKMNISTVLILEYESVLKREMHLQGKDMSLVDELIDDLVNLANRHAIFYLLRPVLKDADDDFILELAFSSSIDYIVTYNIDNFKRAKKLGLKTIKPKAFLEKIGEIS